MTLRVRPAFATLGQCIGTGSSLQEDAEAMSDIQSTCSNLTDLLRSNSNLSQVRWLLLVARSAALLWICSSAACANAPALQSAEACSLCQSALACRRHS